MALGRWLDICDWVDYWHVLYYPRFRRPLTQAVGQQLKTDNSGRCSEIITRNADLFHRSLSASPLTLPDSIVTLGASALTLPESIRDSPRLLLADRVHAVGEYGPYELLSAGGRYQAIDGRGTLEYAPLQDRHFKTTEPIRQVEERERDARHS